MGYLFGVRQQGNVLLGRNTSTSIWSVRQEKYIIFGCLMVHERQVAF
jgi:hypothetical protein